jgi:hypothetical protein
MAGYEFEAGFLGDVALDAHAETAVGVNGVNVTAAAFQDDRIELTQETSFRRESGVLLGLTAKDGKTRDIIVNGKTVGTTARESIRLDGQPTYSPHAHDFQIDLGQAGEDVLQFGLVSIQVDQGLRVGR